MHGQTIININELYKGATLISYPSLIFVVPVAPILLIFICLLFLKRFHINNKHNIINNII